MRNLVTKIETLFLSNNLWIFIAAICWNSIGHTLYEPSNSWKEYFTYLLIVSTLSLPVLFFEWNKPRLKRQLGKRKYIILWIGCFGVYLPTIILLQFWLSDYLIEPLRGSIVFLTWIIFLSLDLILEFNTWLIKQIGNIHWIKKFGLEKSILLTLFLLAFIFSLMGVSSISDPRYHTSERLLVGPVIDIWKVFKHFATFLSFLIQIFFMYLVGYFYYFINNRFLVPRLLKQKGVLIYCFGIVAVTGILYPFLGQILILLPLNNTFGNIFAENPFKEENALGAIAIMIISLPVILALQWFQQNNVITALEKDKAQTELNLLKQQLNPHFFFNTLNNLYALSLNKSEKTPEVILQLSELMRYVIYKGNEELVTIREEINYIEDYIQLQTIRMANAPKIDFEKVIQDPTLQLPPLLLIILVENAFKHGIEQTEHECYLQMSVTCSNSQLHFTCINSVEDKKNNKHGIGLENLKKRLELLFPEKHTLNTQLLVNQFKAELLINLN